MPIPVAGRSKVWVWGRSLAGTAGSNPTGGMYRDAVKSVARPDWKKQLKGRHFSSDAEVFAAAETWLGGQPPEFFWVACKSLVAVARFLPCRSKDLSAPRYVCLFLMLCVKKKFPCVGLINRPEESYRLWCVWVWSRSLDNDKVLAHWGLLSLEKECVLKYNILEPCSLLLLP